MTSESDRWYDDAAGPVVRPYAMTRGRTSHAAEAKLDLIALVLAQDDEADAEVDDDRTLSPEHLDIVEHCRVQSVSVAELAADLDLPVGVVRVLIGDLLEAGHVLVHQPVPPAELPDESILREVINGLRAL
jgi:DNA-directed RNA polymerase specialized sigma24 family protein